MKKVLVAFACAAGMLLMLSNVCNSDNDGGTAVGGKGNKGRSGYPIQPFTLGCSPSGGIVTGGLLHYTGCDQTTCSSTAYNPVGGGCFRVSDGIVTISFGRDAESQRSIEFLVAEADVKAAAKAGILVGTTVVAGTSVVFRGLETGRGLEPDEYNSAPCWEASNGNDDTLMINAWVDNDTSGGLSSGDTIDVSWSETRAYRKYEDGDCSTCMHIISCGTATLIPFGV
jgi:hypothetical protein